MTADEARPEITGTPPSKPPRRRPRRAVRAVAAILVTLVLLLGALASVGWMLQGQPRTLPVWVVAETEARLNKALGGRAHLSIGGLQVMFAPDRLPELRMHDLRVTPVGGGGSVRLPEAIARFSGGALLRGRVEPISARLSGTQIALRREADGRLAIDLGGEGESPTSFGDLLRRIDGFVALPLLASLQRVEAEAITVTLDDRRAGRIWTVGDGRMTLRRTDQQTVLDVGLGLVSGGAAPATAQLAFGIGHGGAGAQIQARVDNVAAADIAAQAAVLAWLGILDAPISGDLRAALDAEGRITDLGGSLSVGAGALSPTPGAQPLPIHRADIGFGFDPERQRIIADRVIVDSPTLRLRAAAHADLLGLEDGLPTAWVAQLRFDELLVDPAGVFEEPVRFSKGAMDLRLRLDPFSLDLGQLSLVEEGRHLQARGGASAGADGWTLALDLELDAIRHDRLLALWPLGLVPRTRAWLVNNVQQGLLFDVKAGLRLRPGQQPRLSLGYEFADADVRYMPTLPPIQGGRGYASIEGQTYLTVVEDGLVIPPEGGAIDVARSVFMVPDITKIPARAEITLQSTSSLTAALSLLDQPPFGFLSRGGMKPDLAEGKARLTTSLKLPLVARVQPDQVEFSVKGVLEDVRSTTLAPGKVLTAPRLDLTADPAGIAIAGKGRLGQAAFEARWQLPIGPGTNGSSKVAGTVTLDQGFASEFLAALGQDVMSGTGRASFDLTLPRAEAPRLSLRSDLGGVRVAIPALGWTKAAGDKGRLQLEGTLRAPMRFERLLLQGEGLAVEGRLSLAEGGGLDRLDLSRLQIGHWLDATAEVIGRGPGRAPGLRVTGGQADIRHLPKSTGGSGGQGVTVDVGLDRVQISNTQALHGVRATLSPVPGGIDGSFVGQLNGRAALEGRLIPGRGGTSLQITARDGGAVMAAARIFAKARGGELDMTLTPTGVPGHWDGNIRMSQFRVHDMPALAELLNAVSIVGLLEQLETSGLLFAQGGGQFRLTPDAIELREFWAAGASFGVSLEGVYSLRDDLLNLRGVLSPFFIVNGIGSVLTRPGEGLMGFTYRVQGRAAAPRVTVNPLSVLAPGFLRDMLRRPAARIAE